MYMTTRIIKKPRYLHLIAYSVLCLFFVVTACSLNQPDSLSQEAVLDHQYQDAIRDAEVAEADEICTALTPITDSNENLIWEEVSGNRYVLMVTLTRYTDSYPVDEVVTTSWGYTWVTAAPELKNKIVSLNVSASALSLRLKQVLGLPYTSVYTHIIEVWVNPADLFRPSPDNEITDATSGLDFPPGTPEDYRIWFEANKNYTATGYPWTRLGYTYDWGDPSHEVGLSEFVITPSAHIIVKSNQTIEVYIGD